jgi:hypothetical protein
MAPPSPPTGPSSEEISSQAKAFQQLTAVLLELGKAQQLSGTAARSMRDGMSEVGESFKELEASLKKAKEADSDWRKGIKESIDKIEDLSDAAGVARKILTNLAKENKKLAEAMAFGAGAIKGFAAGFKFLKAAATSVIGVIQSVGSALFDLGAAILSAPFKMLEGLIGMAKEGMGSTELAQAFENVREVFGDVSRDAGGSVIKLGASLTQGMIGPGLSAIRVFGTLAEATEYANKVASASPVLFDSMRDQFEKNGKSILAMSKGLGIAEEDFTGLMSAAKATGREVEDIEVEIAKYAKGLSAQFGLNSKLISRDMGKAMKDVKHFANSTVQEIAKASTYAHGLGLELKDITGVLDAFNTFDQAAENVSKLSQAFGVNIDTMKLLEAKTPDDALAMLKDSLAAAGKSADSMNRQELQLLASTVGMSEEAVRQSFSLKNQGIAHNKVTQAAKGLEAQSMSTSEAISTMTNDIVRAVKAGPTPESNSLWGMFFDGFLQGITRTGEFRELLANLRKDFYVIIGAGRELGVAFVEAFPGFKEILQGLADVLSPQKIGGLFNSFKDTFKKFFEDIRSGTGTVKGLMEALQGNFTDYLTKAGPGGQKLLQGLHDFWEAAKKIIISGIDYLGDMLKEAFDGIADAISGKYDSAIGGALGGVQKEVSPIITALGGLFEKIKGPLARIFDQFFDWIGGKISEFWSKHWGKILAVTIGPSIISGLGSVMAARFAQGPLVAALNRVAGTAPTQGAPGTPTPGAGGPASAASQAAATGPQQPDYGPTKTAMAKGAASNIGNAALNVAQFAGKAIVAVKAMEELMSVIKKANLSEKDFQQVMAIVDALLNFYSKSQAIAGVTGVVQTMADKLPQGKIEGGGRGASAGGASGYAVIAATIVGMLIAGEAIILAAAKHDFDVNKLNAIGSIIDPIGNMFLKAALVAGAGTALGSIITTSAGLAVGALAAGLGAIGTVVAAMIGTAEYMIKAAASLQGDGAQIKAKAEAMSAIITAISGMMTASAETINAMPFSLFDTVTSRKDKFDKVKETLENIFGKDSKSGIMGIITTIKDAASTLNESNVGTVTAMAGVFGAIGNIVGGISKAIEAMNSKVNGEALFGLIKIGGSTLSTEVLGAVNNFLDVFMGRSQTLVDTILTALQKVPADKAEAIGKAGGGIAQIISALGSMVSSMTSGLSSFVKKTSTDTKGASIQAGIQAVTSTTEAFDATSFSTMISALEQKMPTIITSLNTMFKVITADVVTTVEKLTPQTIEGVASIVSIISALGSMMSSLSKSTSSATPSINAAGINTTINITLPSLTEILDSMAKSLPKMIRRVLKAVHKASVTPSDVQKLTSVGKIFETVGTLFDIVNKISPSIMLIDEAANEAAGQTLVSNKLDVKAMADQLVERFEVIATALETLTAGDKSKVFTRINNASKNIPTIDPRASSNLKGITTLFTSLNEMSVSTAPLMSLSSDVMRLENGAPTWKKEINFDLSPIATGIESLSSPDSGIEKLVTAASKLGTSIDAGKIQTMATAAAAVKGFFSQVNVLSNAASFGMKTALDAGLVKTAEEIKNHIGAMAKAMAEFQTQIDAINVSAADNINVKLGKTANGLGVKDANYSFTKNGVTLKFNMNVFMDTKQVSAEVSKTGTVIYDAFAAGFPGRVGAGDDGTGVKVNGAGAGTDKASPG